MDGCCDGTLVTTGQKLFNCPPGYGIYYPLAELEVDKGSREFCKIVL